MCEAVQALADQAMNGTKAKSKKADDLLIADKDKDGRPVGRGGRTREERIMDIVNGTQLTIPGE